MQFLSFQVFDFQDEKIADFTDFSGTLKFKNYLLEPIAVE